ncbi:uncharacterized protein LOC123512593 isoform X2 [Portunus trituberculatus]|uniref:uncharacterized protein LOC123512593 isoform X2 n=1 Tax=Portunus trituberculatus TaxID=210409 RepID=UPI001E1CB696|nr:uncharacterized protein LOC123512593 isoform X2 [Portunus trituberculatus]
MNTMANQSSVETRKTIISLSVPEVARKLGLPATSVQTMGNYHQSIVNRSQHKDPISLQYRAIIEAIRANPKISAAQLKKQCNLPFSLSTVTRRKRKLLKHLGFDTPPVDGSPGQILKASLTGASVKRKIRKDSEGSDNSCLKKKCTLERRDEMAVDMKQEEREEVKMEVVEEALEEERDTFDMTTRVQVIDRCVMANSWAQGSTEDDSDHSSGTESAILPLPSPEGHRDDYSDTGPPHVPLLPPGVDTLVKEGLVLTEVGSVLPVAPPKHHPVMHTMSLGDGSNAKLRTLPFASQDSPAQKRVNPGDSDPGMLSLVPHDSPAQKRVNPGDSDPAMLSLVPHDSPAQKRVNPGDTEPEIVVLAPADPLAGEWVSTSEDEAEILPPEDPLAPKNVTVNALKPALVSGAFEGEPLVQERLERSHQRESEEGSEQLETGSTSVPVMLDTDDMSTSIVVLDSDEDVVSLSDSDEAKECEAVDGEEGRRGVRDAAFLDSDSSCIDSEDDEVLLHVSKTNVIKEVPWNWKSGDFLPNLFLFKVFRREAATTRHIAKSNTALHIFLYFFDAALVDFIAQETNKQYKYVTWSTLQFSDVTRDELYVFLGLCMLRSHLSNGSSRNFWKAVQDIYSSSRFNVMTEERYNMIAKMLHFSSSHTHHSHTKDPLDKIRPVFSRLQKKFRDGITPSRNLMIDESQALFTSCLNNSLSIPSKKHDYEVKTYVLCDCNTGFVTDLLFYSSMISGFSRDCHGTVGSIVKTLVAPLYGRGHTLFVSDWCSNPKLFHFLHTKKVGACGTVKPGLKSCPKFDNIPKRESVAYHANNVLALKWQEEEPLHVLSTVHGWEAASKSKPLAVVNHRNATRRFGVADVQTDTDEIGVSKWYKKLFFHLLDLAVLNTHALFDPKSGMKPKYRAFHRQLTDQILMAFMLKTKGTEECRTKRKAEEANNPLRFKLSMGHFPRKHGDGGSKVVERSQCCVVCLKSRSHKPQEVQTRYYCSVCNVPLCVVPCFERYHTVKDF